MLSPFILIVTSFAIDKMFEIYTFSKVGPKFTLFSKIGPKFTLFFENGFEIYTFVLAFCSKIGLSNFLSMVD